MAQIEVTIASPGEGTAAQRDDLDPRAHPNVFVHPAALAAVAETGFAKLRLLLAWDKSIAPARLVGWWALQERTIAPLLPAVLIAPAYDYAFLSCPVVDRTCMADVIPAFLDAVRDDPRLPNVIRLNYLDGEGDTYRVMVEAVAARGEEPMTLSLRGRPFASRDCGQKLLGSTRKKLRQDWNRLSAQGAVDILNDRAPQAVETAFETFLAMEAKSWKGEQGTALLSRRKHAGFARALIRNLAAKASASVALLCLDGHPIAAQVLLYCGPIAYTWKTAFDVEYAKYSPGALLVDKLTEQLFASGTIEAIDSCSPEGGFMNQLWSGRRTTIDLLVNVQARRSPSFALAVMIERGYRELKRQRDTLRALPWFALPKRKSLAASPTCAASGLATGAGVKPDPPAQLGSSST